MARRITAGLLLALLVAGSPMVLLMIGFYDWGRLSLAAPVDLRFVLAALTVAAWAAWVVFLVSCALEAIRFLSSGRVALHVPGLGAPRALAGALIGSILAVGFASIASDRDSPAPVRVAEPAVPERQPEAETAEGPLTYASPEVIDHDLLVHMVAPGDDLWSLAEGYYGSGDDWRRIVAANPDLQADPTADLEVGTALAITDPVEIHTVRPGDTLSGIALERLGDASRWPEIHRLNRDRVADPDHIEVGWTLRVPRVAGEPNIPRPSVGGKGPVARPRPRGVQPSPSAPAPATPPAADPAPEQAPQTETDETDRTQLAATLGALAALSAASLVVGFRWRRQAQRRTRPLGRVPTAPNPEVARVATALALTATPQAEDRLTLVTRALRLLAAHCWAGDRPAPPLEHLVVGDDGLTFHLERGTDTISVPLAFEARDAVIRIEWRDLELLDDVPGPVAYPALVTLGEDAGGRAVMIDLTRRGVVDVGADSAELAFASLSAMLVELTGSPWADELTVTVVTPDERFATAAGLPNVACIPDVEAGVAEVERRCRERRALLDLCQGEYDVARLDPDRADAWAPCVVLFEVMPSPAMRARLDAALDGPRLGVAAVLPGEDGVVPQPAWRLEGADPPSGVWAPTGLELSAQTLPPEARGAIADLYAAATSSETISAPWWRDTPISPAEEDDTVKVIPLRPARGVAAPQLHLFGAVRLTDAAGEVPARTPRQCLEYCAWLLEHPGSTATEMSRALFVADGTRRSNLSRLRGWLGNAPDGTAYLPDAYSGRIALHPAVSSDWQELQGLVDVGVNRASPERLRAALRLVVGAPMADAAPGQWAWADDLRSDMAALVRDIGLVLAGICRERQDDEGAWWAASTALLAAPGDEQLTCELIRTEHARGRTDAVARLARELTRRAASDGTDLLDETVGLLQEVMEGRRRRVRDA